MTNRVRVAVGVLTYRRPEMLVRLLPVLVRQLCTLPDSHTGQVLVIDNDPAASAESATFGFGEIVYVHEPTPGIAAARARAVSEAAARGFDLLQFMDDDEEPSEMWLANMVETWSRHGRPAAVAGAVVATFDEPPSAWIEAGEFFVRKRPPTGTALRAAPAGNLLLDVGQVTALGVQFDRRLGLRGGEDTLFTRQLASRGGRIIFCDDAPIADLVPPARATRPWVLKRAWHHGGTHAFAVLSEVPPGRRRFRKRLALIVGGTVRVAAGSLKALRGVLTRDLARNAKGWRLAYRGAGILAESVAGTPPEYSRTPD